MEQTHRSSAEQIRAQLLRAQLTPPELRAALISVPAGDRDAWLDLLLGIDSLPDDGPELPRGCVPYLPCAVFALLRVVDQAGVQASDVFVDVGAGIGRAAILVHLLTGAATIGIEIQPALVDAAKALALRLHLTQCALIAGDATQLTGTIESGSVFFFYCPFSGSRLEKVLDDLEAIARRRPIRVCCVDLPLPPRKWLTLLSVPGVDVAVYRSTLLDKSELAVHG